MNDGMDRSNLALAAKLLAKAQDTPFEPEAAALAEKAYVLLAEFLNGLEEEQSNSGRARRRERRLRHDRRITRRMFGWRSSSPRPDPAAVYRQDVESGGDGPEGGDIDLRA
jgi:hypothetical protein